MKDSTIRNTGKYTAVISFLLGSFFLFGYFFTGKTDFAILGYLYLYIAAAANLLLIGMLLLYGAIHPQKLPACRKAAIFTLVNIPVALLYTYIGYYFVIHSL